jgi:hypothetical protein
MSTKGLAKIQVQDYTGNWVTIGTTIMSDQGIFRAITSAKKTFKGKIVRALDPEGNMIQLQ